MLDDQTVERLRGDALEQVVELFETWTDEDVAAALPQLETARQVALVTQLLPERTGPWLLGLADDVLRETFDALRPRTIARVVAHLDPADGETLLGKATPPVQERVRLIMGYPPDSVGGNMDPEVGALHVGDDIAAAIAWLRQAPPHIVHYLYVVDDERHLLGVVTMRDLLLHAATTPLTTILRPDVVKVAADDGMDDVSDLMSHHSYAVLPVIDHEDRLIGVVRHGALIDAARIEAFQNVQKMVGAGGEEEALSPISTVVKKRLPWLLVNLVTAFMAAAVVGLFESTIAAVTALAVLLPVVAGQSGNTGMQALAVVMRGIALKEVRPGVTGRLVLKELAGGLINGIAVAIVTGLCVWVWDGRLALVVIIASSMVVAMGIAAIAGALIPLGIAATGRDPAQSSSIFLTTVTDVFGFGAFLGMALLLMSWLQATA